MSTETRSLERTNPISRRGFIGGMGVIAASTGQISVPSLRAKGAGMPTPG